MGKFLIPIDLEPNTFIDSHYIKTKLIPHFTQSLKTIKQALLENTESLNNAKATIQSLKFVEDDANSYTNNFLNQDIIRTLKILSKKYDEITQTEVHHKITFLEQKIFHLTQLKNITTFFIENPRLYFINLEFFNRKTSSQIFELLPELYIEKNSLEQKLALLRSQIEFIPVPFLKRNENVDFVCHIISIALQMKDPKTKIVQCVPEFTIFRHFLVSTESPIQLHSFVNLSPDAVEQEIHTKTRQLLQFGNFNTNDKDVFEVVYYLLFDFFFEDYYGALEIEALKSQSGKVTQIISDSQRLKLDEIGFDRINESIFSNQTAKEYFDSFSSLTSDLMTTQFLFNPIDILFCIEKIDAELKSHFLFDDCELEKSNEILSIAWKGLFIASGIPAIEIIFEKMNKWKNILLTKSIYEQICTIPRTILQNWASQ